MPKRAKELTATAVEKLKADGSKNRRIMVGPADCAGLHLRIEGGTKSWALRIKVADKRRDIGLGPYNGKIGVTDEEATRLDGLSLAEARWKARELRRGARETGSILSPTKAKAEAVRAQSEAALIETARTKTFAECAAIVVEKKGATLKNPKHLAQWTSTLKTYAYPTLGERAVGTITKGDVAAVLEPIWRTKNETADRLRGRMEAVFDYAKAMGYREGDNPAAWKGNLEPILGGINREVRHQPSLSHSRIGAFMTELRKRDGTSARAMEFAILCAARSGEALGATWAEIDLDAKMWIIPASRMKKKREHHVPLSDAAVAILKAQKALKIENVEYVFPAARGGKLSDMALSMLVRRMNGEKPKVVDGRTGEPVVPHGFRSTFRDWAGETTAYPREVIEHALAHSLPDKAEAAYQRGTLLPKRARLMDDWAKRCATPDATAGNVVSINQAVA